MAEGGEVPGSGRPIQGFGETCSREGRGVHPEVASPSGEDAGLSTGFGGKEGEDHERGSLFGRCRLLLFRCCPNANARGLFHVHLHFVCDGMDGWVGVSPEEKGF